MSVIPIEPFTFDWQAGSSGDESWRGKARSWIDDKPGRTRALTANRTLAVAHALRSEGADASEDGTGRGTPLVTAYRTAGNCGPFEQGDKAGALNTATDPSQNIICFSSKDHGADAGEIAPTLRSQNFDKSHINGGGQVAIAFRTNQTGAQGPIHSEELTDSLAQDHPPAVAIAFAENQRGEIRTSDVSPQLSCAGGKPGSGYSATAGGFGVRRLTPRECERLQGFPDDFTRYDASGKEISDSARYRMLGNAVAVPVSRWIGKRIMSMI